MQNYQIITKRRFDEMVAWLKQHCPKQTTINGQAVRGSDAEAYWHMDYCAALHDRIRT